MITGLQGLRSWSNLSIGKGKDNNGTKRKMISLSEKTVTDRLFNEYFYMYTIRCIMKYRGMFALDFCVYYKWMYWGLIYNGNDGF